MADKKRTFVAPARKMNLKRASTVPISRGNVAGASVTRPPVVRSEIIENATIISEGDVTVQPDCVLPDFDEEYQQVAYGKFLLTMLEDCLFDERVEREESDMDVQMALLADRFMKTMDQLDKTNRRIKEISFVVENKRLLDLKSQDCTNFLDMTDKSNVKDLVDNLTAAEVKRLDNFETKNVDFGYDKDSGHKQLLDAVNEAIEGLEQIKKHSKLDMAKFKQYEKLETNLKEQEKDLIARDSLKGEFDAKFPKFSDKLLKEVSRKVAMMLDDNDNTEDGDVEDDD